MIPQGMADIPVRYIIHKLNVGLIQNVIGWWIQVGGDIVKMVD